jgi:hypothetical protein
VTMFPNYLCLRDGSPFTVPRGLKVILGRKG